MKFFILHLFVLGTFLLNAQTYNGPESVVFDSTGNRYFISNNGANQILVRNANAQLSVFTSDIASGPHGLEIVGNTLYACDGSFLKGFDLSNGTRTLNLNLGATFLNGICSDGGDFLYATDFSAKKIFKINIATQTFSTFISGLAKSPNGIIYDGDNQRIIWVTWNASAPIMQASLADSTASQLLATNLSNCDGIVRDGNGNYYVSSWGGQAVYKFNNTFSTAPLAVVTGLSNPADIYYNLTNDSLVVPNTSNNTLSFHFMGTQTAVDEETITKLKVYPNPANDKLYIEQTENIEFVEIQDISGRVVFRENNLNKSLVELDIAALNSGIYTLKIKSGGRVYVDRFVRK
jgi:hypothetical protein